jgi:hypothetical protein
MADKKYNSEYYQKNKDEINTKRREQVANNPEYREKLNAQWREKYANNPEYREKRKTQHREKYANNPDWKKESAQARKEKRTNDPEYREKENARSRELYTNDPEYRERKNTRERKQRVNNPKYREKINTKRRESDLKRKYNITPEEYNRIFEEQEGKCKICETPQSELKKRLAVDHCHHSGKVRGLICSRCNTGMGNLRDDPKLLEKAKQYLESFSE